MTSKPKPLFYPPHVARNASPEELAAIVEGNLQALDEQGADLLDMIANHHRDDWQDPKHAMFARRVLRQVSAHLRDRR